MNTQAHESHQPVFPHVALFGLALFAYMAALGGGFLFDDIQQILANPALRAIGTPAQNWIAVALSSDSGLLRRPLSMLAFGANVAAFGMSPFWFKAVNLGLHLVNGALVYALARRLLARLAPSEHRFAPQELALLAAGLWLLHPLNVSSVGYVVQRMNELSALFTLCGLIGYAAARERLQRGASALLALFTGLCAFGLLAVLAKENGALIFAYALVIEAVCYRFAAPRPAQRIAIKTFFVLTIALPIILFGAFLALNPHWLADSYSVRSFTLWQRVLTEPRVLCDYLLWTFVPNPAWMGIYHDDIAVSTGVLQPASTLFAIAFLGALVAAAIKLRDRAPGFAFAVAWFLAGHAMESTVLPLELAFEHRNYLPMVGLLLGLVAVITQRVQVRWPAMRLGGAATAVLVCLAVITGVRASSWGDPLQLALDDANHHPQSARAQYEAGRALVVDAVTNKGDRAKAEQLALPYYARSATLDADFVHPVTESLLIHAKAGPVAQSDITELAARLRRAPTYTQANPFLDMLNDVSLKPFSLTPNNVATLVDAAMDNPHLPSKVRAMILNDYGAYKFNIEHDAQSAIALTLAAAGEQPKNPYFQLNLAKIALAVRQPAKADEFLQAARKLDGAGSYAAEIEAVQRQLAR